MTKKISNQKSNKYFLNNNGYGLLLGVIILGAASLAVVLSMTFSGLNAKRGSNLLLDSMQARASANACVELALEEVRNNINYSDSGGEIFPLGNCSYQVFILSGEGRRIEATGLSRLSTRKVKVQIESLSPQISLSNWEEVGSF
jgi:hypothetical protein